MFYGNPPGFWMVNSPFLSATSPGVERHLSHDQPRHPDRLAGAGPREKSRREMIDTCTLDILLDILWKNDEQLAILCYIIDH
jgi:hypothetical protein